MYMYVHYMYTVVILHVCGLYSLIDCVTNNRVRLAQQSGLKIIDGPPPEYVSITSS